MGVNVKKKEKKKKESTHIPTVKGYGQQKVLFCTNDTTRLVFIIIKSRSQILS